MLFVCLGNGGNNSCGGCQRPDPSERLPLYGFVDLHTHPVSNVGFGGKLVYGGASVGALLPSDPNCNARVRAIDEAQALGHDRAAHGGWGLFDNPCGDTIREGIIHELQKMLGGSDPPSDAFGFPTYQHWPVWNDLTHQKMWAEWIRRSFAGGLRVMVALAVNNKTLGDLVSGPGDLPTDDKASTDLQIDEIKRLVAANADFMEVALGAADIARITSIPKLAVVIGVEVDHIGNLQTASWSTIPPTVVVPTAAELKAEIRRLHGAGVRYIFPIHLLDNAFGGTAAYEDVFNVSNARESGAPWSMKCADPADGIDYTLKGSDPLFLLAILKWGHSFLTFPGPACNAGHRNSLALTPNGVEGIREIMRLGMLIDIDHMSQDAVDQTLSEAEKIGYPLFSGHNNVRGPGSRSERALTAPQYARLGALHGMAGVGSSGLDAAVWLKLYEQVLTAMASPGAVAGFGTDTNGFGLGMPPRLGPQKQVTRNPAHRTCRAACPCALIEGRPDPECVPCKTECDATYPATTICVARCDQSAPAVQYTGTFPAPTSGTKTWNYNTDGVAHYGMLPDFLKDVGSLPGGAAVVANAMSGAEYFYQTWRKVETASRAIPCDAGLSNCGGGMCIDLTRNAASCGACGNACASGMSCMEGACGCPSSRLLCGGVCMDKHNNPENCGSCGNVCGEGEICRAGHCRPEL